VNRAVTKSSARRRRWILGSLSLIIIIVIVILLGAYAALSARSHAQKALADFEYVQSNISNATSSAGRASLTTYLENARAESINANKALTSTVVLSAARWIPYFGNEIDGASTLFKDASSAATIGLRLVKSLNTFQSGDATKELSSSSLTALQTSITSARVNFSTLKSPAGTLFGPVGNERRAFNQKVSKVLKSLTSAESGITVAKSLFGAGGTSTVLVLPENNAEMRDQGSILSYSLMHLHGSSISVVGSGSDAAIDLTSPLNVPVSPGTRRWFYIDGANEIFQSVNLTADFAWTGATAAALFQKSTGIHVDDVLALDVPTMAALLSATGPLSVPGISQELTSANFSTIVLHDLYATYPAGTQIPRHTELSTIGSALLQRLRTSRDQLGILKALGSQIPGRHLLLWSASPSVEKAIAQLGASGQVDTVLPTRTFHVAVESAVAAKLGYYVTLRESYNVHLLANGAATVVTTVTEDNTAPAGAPPSYQLGPDGINSDVAGEYVANIYFWSPAGSTRYGSISESGLMLSGITATTMPQHSSSTSFSTQIPDAIKHGHFVIHLVPQPTLKPATISVTVHGSGWKVKNPTRTGISLNQPLTLSFSTEK